MTDITIRDQIERWPIARLVPYARNSRTHSPEQIAQIAASMREWGWTNPVLAREDGIIIAGHGRILAGQQLGLAEAPVIVARGWTDAQVRAYVIADNKLAENAGWDQDMLALELKDLSDQDYNLDLLGFGQADIDAMLAGLDATPEGQTDADAVPEVKAEAVSRTGDVWLLGKHRIMCGDSTQASHVDTLLGGGDAASHGY